MTQDMMTLRALLEKSSDADDSVPDRGSFGESGGS